jgi:dienelactone hydrolase
MAWYRTWILAACAALATGASAQDIDASLNESVLHIPKKGLFTIELETTLFKPDGDGPFPIAVINHGKEAGDTRFQARYRPIQAARYFLQRGYAVVVPMRQGFSKSQGSYIGAGCNVESNGHVQAEDVKAALDHVTAQPWADKTRIVVIGQSHGGWTTLAFGGLSYPGVRGLINFAGGLRQDGCVAWKQNLAASVAGYAKVTQLPSLWFYGDNDSYFGDVYRSMYQQYQAAGGKAQLVAFGNFGSDAHALFGARAGNEVWQPEVSRFLAALGLPHEPQPAFAKFAGPLPMAAPPRSDFASLEDEAKVPYIKANGRAGYKRYLDSPPPRAFAIGADGAWGFAYGGEDPLRRALANCSRNTKAECKLYSVDDHVVWTAQ